MGTYSVVPLQNLCNNFKTDIVDGPFGANLKREHYKTEGIPVLKIQNIKPFNITLKKMDFVDEEKYQELSRHSYQVGDIIMTKLGAPLGESAIVEDIDEGLIVADLVRIRAQKIDTKYLCYHLNSPVTNDYINSQQKGTTRPRVRISVVRELPIYTPPIPEQKRIVVILDQAFADIEQVRAKTEQNLKNARELFESYLQQVFSQRGEGWLESELFDCVKFIDYRGKTPKKTESGLRLITAKNVRMGFLKPNPAEYVSPDSYDEWMTRGIPKKGDVLFTTEAPLANVAQLDTDDKVVFAQRIITMQPDPLVLNSDFLKYMLMSKPVQQRIHDKGTGATCTGIKASLLKKIIIEYPLSVDEQRNIALWFDERKAEVISLERIYTTKLNDLDDLKKSILQKAFTGELTKNDNNGAAT